MSQTTYFKPLRIKVVTVAVALGCMAMALGAGEFFRPRAFGPMKSATRNTNTCCPNSLVTG